MLADKLRSATAAEKLFVDDVFASWLRTGTGASATVTTGIDMTKGYMLWSKGRSGATDHAIYDSARGVTLDLVSNSTAAQTTQAQGLTAVSATGHTIGTLAKMNTNGATYVDWVFRNAPKFFTHTTISHTNGTATNISLTDLGTVGQVVAKITNTTGDWITWHRSLTAGNNLRLNTTAAQTTENAWLSVSGTTATLASAAPTGTYVIHAWAHDTSADGIIQCGSFTTDGSGNVTVTLGWQPQFVIAKKSSSAFNWIMLDVMRGFSHQTQDAYLYANTSGAEVVSIASVFGHPTATGFNTEDFDGSATYIYLAIRRPNKPPTIGTQVYNAIARTGTGAETNFTGAGFTPDYAMIRNSTVEDWVVADRLRGGAPFLAANGLSAEQTDGTYLGSATFSSTMDGIRVVTAGAVNASSNSYINYLFRRAPGFHDQICYTGTGANKTEAHNLGVQPQLWIAKRRNSTGSWTIGSTLLNANEKIVMPSPNGRVTDATAWNSTYPTATNISLGTQADVNASGGTYALWMWATLPGISSVFTYTGNGTSQTVNCGFSTGARFVMIIRITASTAQDIFIWDTARGIVAGNDPRLSLNTTAEEVTTLDTIDTDSTGFIVNTDASNVNVNGAVYIGLAIA